MALPEPFGGLLLLFAIAVAFVVGAVLVFRGWGDRRQVVSGVGVMLAPWLFMLLLAVLSPGIDEWNTAPESRAEACGVWRGGGYTVRLQPDGTFTADLKGTEVRGAWRSVDWNVYLTDNKGVEHYMRFVRDGGELLLLPDPPRTEMVTPGPVMRKRE